MPDAVGKLIRLAHIGYHVTHDAASIQGTSEVWGHWRRQLFAKARMISNAADDAEVSEPITESERQTFASNSSHAVRYPVSVRSVLESRLQVPFTSINGMIAWHARHRGQKRDIRISLHGLVAEEVKVIV